MSVVGVDGVLVALWSFFGPALLNPGTSDPGPHFSPLAGLIALCLMSLVLIGFSVSAKWPLISVVRERRSVRREVDRRLGVPPGG